MRLALAGNRGPRMREKPATIGRETILPVPTEGWDTDTPVAELPPTRAIVLENWIPKGIQLEMRRGSADHVTGLTNPVETLMPYNSGSASKLFAACDTAIYDVTNAGAVGAASDSGFTSARFSWVNFTPGGGTAYLWLCNGVDNPRHYNGSAWATPALTITTYTDNDISYVFESKQRLFFIFKNTLTFGYLPVESVAGTVSNYPLGSVFSRGGRLVAGGTFSHDSGDGPDDYTCFLTSEGEVAVFQGTNPASSADWAKVGTYYCGEPVGDRPVFRLDGDLAILTVNGVLLASNTFNSDAPIDPTRYLSARIGTAFRQATGTNAGNGWEGLYYPAGDLMLINQPINATRSQQFIRHRLTGGWGRFTDWNAGSFAVFNKKLYFGSLAGTIYLADTGNNDDGANVRADYQTAWSVLGLPGQIKTLLEARPIATSRTGASVAIAARTDYRNTPSVPSPPQTTLTGALIWGTGLWGTGLWGGENAGTRAWRAISGEGQTVSLLVRANSNNSPFSMNGIGLRFSKDGQI